MQRFRLQSLGAAVVTRISGEPVGGAATQRRTVALLAALAVAGDSGLSRDKLIGLLWPEVDSERARHSLTQALYSARRALQVDDLFIVGADIRLNEARITSDVRDFELAVAAGDLQQAVDLYRGPFLDGFFVTDSPEFERWSTAQRERLQAKAAGALEHLADASETMGAYRSAIDLRKRLAALSPFDAGGAVKLMTVMARAGDRAAALQYAHAYSTLLRQELDLDPDPVVESLAATLREPLDWSPNDAALLSVGGPAGVTTSTAGAAAPLTAETADGESIRIHPGRSDTGPRSPRMRSATALTPASNASPIAVGVWRPAARTPKWARMAVVAVLATALIGMGVLFGRGSGSNPASYRDLVLRQRVVVAPFRVVGAAPGLEYLRDGIVELLSTRLADDTAARSVDAGGVLAAWRASGLSDAAAVPSDTVVALASRLGAERVVVGSVVGTSTRLVIAATALSVPAGVGRGEVTVSGPVDSITTLIDRLAAKLLVAEAGEDEQLANYTSASLPALRAFLAGQTAFRRHDFAGALREYDVALRRDSSFALAALYRALAADELNDEPQLRVAVTLAWLGRASLNERDRSVLLAFSGPRYPAPSTSEELAAAWQRVVDLGPGSAEAWSALGARLLHDGASAGLGDPLARSADAYQRALALNPGYVAAWRALVQLGGQSSDLSNAATDSSSALREATARVNPFVRWRSAAARGDTVALRHLRDSLPRLGPATLRAIARASQFDAIGMEDGARALSVLRERTTRPLDLASLTLAEHSLAMNRGRPHDALAATSRLRRALPGSHAWMRLRILDRLYAEGDSAAAAAAATELAAVSGDRASISSTGSDTWRSDACVLAQWRLAHGDTAGVRESIAALATAQTIVPPPSLVSAAPNACAVLLDASLAVVRGLPDATSRLQRLDSLVFTPQVAGDAVAYAPLALARLHQRRGETSLALRAIRRRTHMAGWPRYAANTWLAEARLAAQLGDTSGANAAYRRVLTLRSAPEKALVPQIDSVKSLVEQDPDTTSPTVPTDR